MIIRERLPSTPATTSSSIIPIPPDTPLSIFLIGQGFQMSNIRNRTNPANRVVHEKGINSIVIIMPTISSHTIPGWSCTPNESDAIWHQWTPIKNDINTIRQSSQSGNRLNMAMIGRATRVPTVPGAVLDSPEPKPKAENIASEPLICEKVTVWEWDFATVYCYLVEVAILSNTPFTNL